MAGQDAVRAYRAIWSLTEAGKPAVQFIGERIRDLKGEHVAPVDAQRVAKLIAQLDDDDAIMREKATEELKALGPAAEPAMRQALEKSPSPEVNFRLKLLLGHLSDATSHSIHLIRAMEVLENQGTPEARQLLATLAGDSKDTIRHEAKASLARLAQRDAKKLTNPSQVGPIPPICSSTPPFVNRETSFCRPKP